MTRFSSSAARHFFSPRPRSGVRQNRGVTDDRSYDLEISPQPSEEEREAIERAAREVLEGEADVPGAYVNPWWRSGLPGHASRGAE